MPQAICYISHAPILLEENELDELFAHTVYANMEKDITGFLTYKDGTFLQLLEGDKKQIDALFETICKDSRHINITKLLDRPIDRNIFKEYKTGFTGAFRHTEMDELNAFIKSNANSHYGRIFKAFLKPFVLIHA